MAILAIPVQVTGNLDGVNPIILTMDGETPGLVTPEDGAGAQWLFKDEKLYCAYNDGTLGFESLFFSRVKSGHGGVPLPGRWLEKGQTPTAVGSH